MSEVAFVLHRPRSPDNVGAVARIVKNFGLGRLRLVEPLLHREGAVEKSPATGAAGPVIEPKGAPVTGATGGGSPFRDSFAKARAEKLAVGAEDVLQQLYVDRDFPTALASFALVVGTTSRSVRGRPSLHPAEVAELVARSQGPVAILFGDEKRGLSDDELRFCQVVCRIPSSEAQPSLNLAQACAVMGYAVSGARTITPGGPRYAPNPGVGGEDSTDRRPPPPVGLADAHASAAPSFSRVATQADLAALRERLRAVLGPADFLNPQAPDRVLDELLSPLARAQLTPRELELWGNALRKVGLAIGRRA